jgi:dGTP triphosphohydrolase
LQHTIDFIAGMTDRFAINKFQELFVPSEWRPA